MATREKGKGKPRDRATLALPGFAKLLKRKRTPAPHVTWLTPFHDAYLAAYGVKPTEVGMARMGRALKKAVAELGSAKAAVAFAAYLAETEVRFYKIERFAEHALVYASRSAAPTPVASADPLDPRPGEDVDAYIARLARAGSR